jgi:hypothetical protein
MVVVAVAVGVGACGDDGGSGDAAAACEPVGDGKGTKVAVTLDEWKVEAKTASVQAGKVTFDVRNEGEEPHELVIVRTASAQDLKVVDGKVDEEALPAGAFIGEVEAFPAGKSCQGTFELAKGTYQLFCNIVEHHEGMQESHVGQGMITSFEVH